MSSQGDHSDQSRLDEDLVAYLDHELDEPSSRRIEQLLASDPQVRRRLQHLERTWEILDELTPVITDETFSRSTMEMVTAAIQREVDREQVEAPRRRRRWLLGVAGLTAAGLGGFLAVVLVLPDANRQLIRDLPVLERLDQYEQVRDIQFLRLLRKQGLFTGDSTDGP